VIFTVADMSRVWIDFYVPPQDASRVALGQVVTIDQKDRGATAKAVIGYLSPIQSEAAQTTLARVELPNPDGEWRPGAFVSGEITVEEITVPLAVRTSALQTFRDWDVVFMNEGNVFEVRPLELGRRDAEWIEVLSGFAAGQRYAADNSFILKADVGKSGASHDH
jgi:cobalt-zinc-cadmium efflux system membrane fusion protein